MALIVVFTNQSQLAPISDYNVRVLVGDGTPEGSKTLFVGKLEGYHRDKGWALLIKEFIDTLLDGEEVPAQASACAGVEPGPTGGGA